MLGGSATADVVRKYPYIANRVCAIDAVIVKCGQKPGSAGISRPPHFIGKG